jgi:hypothetical protein
MENHRSTVILANQIDPIVNHNHKDDNINEQASNGIDSTNELIEAQKQILLLRKDLNDTNGKLKKIVVLSYFFSISERLALTEDSYRDEQERYRSLTSEYESIHEQLTQLKLRVNKDKNDNHDLVEQQQSELVHLSKSILSKQTEHDQLLSVYICFFLSCYLLIFFLFFFLLPW